VQSDSHRRRLWLKCSSNSSNSSFHALSHDFPIWYQYIGWKTIFPVAWIFPRLMKPLSNVRGAYNKVRLLRACKVLAKWIANEFIVQVRWFPRSTLQSLWYRILWQAPTAFQPYNLLAMLLAWPKFNISEYLLGMYKTQPIFYQLGFFLLLQNIKS